MQTEQNEIEIEDSTMDIDDQPKFNLLSLKRTRLFIITSKDSILY